MRRFLQMTTYFMIFAVGVVTGLIWNIPVQREAAELQVVVDESHRQNEALQVQIRTQQAELTTLRKRPLVAPLVMIESALAPGSDAPSPSGKSPEPTRGAMAERSTENEDKADADEEKTPPATEETAVARLHQFLEDTAGMRRRERRGYMKSLVEELREMGEPVITVLLQSLEEGANVRERRLAARLLGVLQDPIALPALQKVLAGDEDIRMRRAGARSLRLLQMPESIPALESVLNKPAEDHFVRIHAARGLAQLGESQGVNSLVEIFNETVDDGRARFRAFRALTSLNDAAALPLMREIATSESDVSYRLRAVRFLGRNGNQEDLALLQQVLAARNEQPSVVEAAQNAYTALSAGQPQPQ